MLNDWHGVCYTCQPDPNLFVLVESDEEHYSGEYYVCAVDLRTKHRVADNGETGYCCEDPLQVNAVIHHIVQTFGNTQGGNDEAR